MPATLTVHPWPDPVIDTLGHDPRSIYVETFGRQHSGPHRCYFSGELLRGLARLSTEWSSMLLSSQKR